MLIGFDFDNTIVSYDALFHKVAVEQKVVPETIDVNKVAVRNYLRNENKEDIWTEMQGYVYGERMQEASPFEGVIGFIAEAKKQGHELRIVSHKTRFPFMGPQYDLHASAIKWIETHLWQDGTPLLSGDQYFFEQTKDEKIERIRSCGCEMYIDDLPEILLHKHFPATTVKYLFDPEKHHAGEDFPDLKPVHSWEQLRRELL